MPRHSVNNQATDEPSNHTKKRQDTQHHRRFSHGQVFHHKSILMGDAANLS